MSSGDVQVSDNFSGGRSTNFSTTCTLLRRYLKEKGTIGELTLALNRMSDSKVVDPMQTFEDSGDGCGHNESGFLPQPIAGVGEVIKEPDLRCEKFRTQTASNTNTMTIFYAGQLVVINDVPAVKAQEIFQIATGSPDSTSCIPTTAVANNFFHTLARKNSIARFLEKRKHRVISNAPYAAPSKRASPAYDEEWLRLSPPWLTDQN